MISRNTLIIAGDPNSLVKDCKLAEKKGIGGEKETIAFQSEERCTCEDIQLRARLVLTKRMTGAAISKRTPSWCVSGAIASAVERSQATMPNTKSNSTSAIRCRAKQRTPKPSERAAALGSVRKHLDSPHEETVSTACAGQQRNGHVTAIPISLASLAKFFFRDGFRKFAAMKQRDFKKATRFLLGRFANSQNFSRVW